MAYSWARQAVVIGVIAGFRAERERRGLCCPHCDSRHVIRWGTFSGRRRYRCRGCARTFSDLTHTAVAHLKRIDLWALFCDGFEVVETIRAGAARLGVDPSTSFRWRHRLLASLLRSDRTRFGDSVTVGVGHVPYSRKGSRSPGPDGRILAASAVFGVPSVSVLAAYQSEQRTWAAKVGLRRAGMRDVERLLGPRLDRGSVVLSREGRFGAVGAWAAWTGARWSRLPRMGGPGIRDAASYLVRFRRWLRRFRGVASRYLDHYLVWHRLLAAVRVETRTFRPGILVGRYGPRVPQWRASAAIASTRRSTSRSVV